MRNIMETRIRRLEELLKAGTSTPMVVIKDKNGFIWNNVSYNTDEALTIATQRILGDIWERPLIIVDRRH